MGVRSREMSGISRVCIFPRLAFLTLHLRRWHTNTCPGIRLIDDDEVVPVDGAFDIDAEDSTTHPPRSFAESFEDLDIATRAEDPLPSVEIDVGGDGFLDEAFELSKM